MSLFFLYFAPLTAFTVPHVGIQVKNRTASFSETVENLMITSYYTALLYIPRAYTSGNTDFFAGAPFLGSLNECIDAGRNWYHWFLARRYRPIDKIGTSVI